MNGAHEIGIVIASLALTFAWPSLAQTAEASLRMTRDGSQDRQWRGIHDAPGREPERSIPAGGALLAAGAVNQARISGGPVKNAVTDFAPLINQYLQAHLFGAIFERDNLDWTSRELATVGALAATPGVEAQLRSHMRASLCVGLTAAQLRQLTQALVAAAGG